MALDMLPALSTLDLADSGLVDTEDFGQVSLLHGARPDRSDVFCRELGVPVSLASSLTVSLDALLHVFLVGAKTQMVGIDAYRTITGVQDMKTVRGSFVNPVGNDVCSMLGSSKSNSSVATSVDTPGPIPAVCFGGRSGHVVGKSLRFAHPLRLVSGGSGKWVSVSKKPSSVRGAVTPPSRRHFARINRALLHAGSMAQ